MAVQVLATDITKLMKRLPTEKMARTAASRAINRAIHAGRTQAAREATKQYAVRQRQVNDKIKVSKASPTKLSAGVTWRGKSMNLSDFRVTPSNPQPAKRPVIRAMVSRKSGMQPYRGAFVVNTRSGGVKVYRRTSQAVANKSRYPITGVWGPSIPQMLNAKDVREAVETRAGEVLHLRIDHEVNRLLLGGTGRA